MEIQRSFASVLAGTWQRLPLVIRAVLTGLLVFEVLQLTQFIILANTELAPAYPWGVFLAALVMWLLWKYFSGWGWPATTRSSRQTLMRTHATSRERRHLSFLAVPACLMCMIGIAIVSSSLIKFPEASFALPSFFGEMPPVTGFFIILGFSLAAGVSEEAGFRGYMQVPLEQKYGPFRAILFIATLFWLAHYSSPSFFHRAGLLLTGGILAGYLSYLSRSLIPAVIVHSLADAIGFVMVAGYFGLPPIYTTAIIWETGVTGIFLAGVVLMLAGGGGCVWIFNRMMKLAN